MINSGIRGRYHRIRGMAMKRSLKNPEDREQTEATEIRVVIVLKQMLCVSDRREKWQKDLQDIPN